MRQRESRHLAIKVIFGIVALFLIVVAFMDFTPTSKTVEKTVSYPVK